MDTVLIGWMFDCPQDELLRCLSEEVRGGRGRSGSLLEELTRLEALAGGEEYNRPLSPLDLVTGVSTRTRVRGQALWPVVVNLV